PTGTSQTNVIIANGVRLRDQGQSFDFNVVSNNTDPLYMRALYTGSDKTTLLVNIGDNPGQDEDRLGIYTRDTQDLHHYFSAAGNAWHRGDLTAARLFAQSMTDTNNTAFFVDPSGNTVINNLTIMGTCSGCFSTTEGSFIHNQFTAPQTANFWIAGTGRVDSKMEIRGAAALDSPVLNLINTADTWYNIQFKRGTSDAKDFFIGRGISTYLNGRALAIHVPSAQAEYGGGAQPKIAFVSSGAVTLGYVEAVTGNWYMKGNVGIGTTTPGVALDIDGGTSSTTRLRIRNAANAAGLLLGQDTNTDFTLFNVSNGYLRFGTNNLERVRITAGGNVGIGTGAPSQKLHVSGNLRVEGAYYDSSNLPGTNGQVLMSTASGTKWVNPSTLSDGDWVISGNNMYSGVSGNVGIGTSAPSQKLHVAGNTIVTGWLGVGGATPGGTGGTSGVGISFPAGSNDSHKIFGEHNGSDSSRLVIQQTDNADDAVIFRNIDCCAGGTLDYMKIARNGLY
ncbi:MAG: hypothetical protein D6812_09965, partial [Deltaproteobacteria bacterium]